MAKGFPQARLRKQLLDVDFELDQWIERYVEEIQDAPSHRVPALDERIAALRKGKDQLDAVFHTLAWLPRLS